MELSRFWIRSVANLAHGAGLIGVNQCIGGTDSYGLIHRGQLELDGVFSRNRGTNLDRFGCRCKARLANLEPVDAKGQALHVQAALIAGRQSVSILIRLADDLNGCFHAKARRIGHFKAQFTAIALAKEWQGAKEKNNRKSLHEESASLV
jgi:hypothetical protein